MVRTAVIHLSPGGYEGQEAEYDGPQDPGSAYLEIVLSPGGYEGQEAEYDDPQGPRQCIFICSSLMWWL